MANQKYIAVLTEGKLEQEIIDALIGCGYKLKRESNHGGCITNHYEKAINKNKKYSNFGNVCDVTGSMG